jgi:biotin carboxyl carrier protein
VTVDGIEPRVFELAADAVMAALDPDTVDAAPARPGTVTVVPLPGDLAATVTRYEVVVDGWRFIVGIEPAARAELRERGSRTGERGRSSGRQVVRAQIPGRIGSVAIGPGDPVERGQLLLVVEAMKMENAVIAPRAGTIVRIGVVAGQTVELGDELVVIE